MSNLKELKPKPQQEVIETLKEALKQAEDGLINNVCVVYWGRQDKDGDPVYLHAYAGPSSFVEKLGALTLMASSMVKRMTSGNLDDVGEEK